jgi:membrane-associated phospholipid phosphatase
MLLLTLALPLSASPGLAEEDILHSRAPFPLNWKADRYGAAAEFYSSFDPDLTWLYLDEAPAIDSGSSGAGAPAPYMPPNWLAGKPNLGSWFTTGALAAGWAVLANEGDANQIAEAGDTTQFLPLAAGVGVSLGSKDYQGFKQLAYAGLSTGAIVHLFKSTNDKYRPDGTDTKSFPSGHTAASFSGSSFILRRYGPKWGIPATVMAAYTGYSRVYAEKHFTDDVISGMSIAMMFTWLFVDPADPERAARSRDNSRPRYYRYEWEIADGNVGRNDVQAPGDTGTLIDYRFSERANPHTTSSISFDFILAERHNVRSRFTPFEVRDIGTLTQDTMIGDQILPKDSEVFSIYFFGDLRIRYAYELLPESRFNLLLGGGLTYIDTDLTIGHPDRRRRRRADTRSRRPSAALSAGGSRPHQRSRAIPGG